MLIGISCTRDQKLLDNLWHTPDKLGVSLFSRSEPTCQPSQCLLMIACCVLCFFLAARTFTQKALGLCVQRLKIFRLGSASRDICKQFLAGLLEGAQFLGINAIRRLAGFGIAHQLFQVCDQGTLFDKSGEVGFDVINRRPLAEALNLVVQVFNFAAQRVKTLFLRFDIGDYTVQLRFSCVQSGLAVGIRGSDAIPVHGIACILKLASQFAQPLSSFIGFSLLIGELLRECINMSKALLKNTTFIRFTILVARSDTPQILD